MNTLARILLSILVFGSIINCQLKHERKAPNDNEIEELLGELSEKLDRNKQEYPNGYHIGQRSNKAQVFKVKKKSMNNLLVDSNKPVSIETEKSQQNDGQHNSSKSWKVFFILCILGCSIILIHFLIKFELHFLPESIAVVFLGSIIGLVFKLISQSGIADWTKEESFSPTMFFFVLLPPIIFESGYNLNKGNFFENIGSICVFAIFGTAISAFVMGSGVYLLGKSTLTYEFEAKEAFAFGSLVSAVDPVATLAIFNALDIDPILYMLVFGESILNDAVAIVLTNTIMELSDTTHSIIWVLGYVVGRFCLMFFASALIGCLFGILSALTFKYIDLRKTPSLETSFMFIFMYTPYAFAEALHLSGIMAILFAGLVMSHYTHFNLSSVTRISVQQIFRTLSFVAETCVFAYLGMAIFSFRHIFKPSLVIFSLIMCLVSRACNIFPLSFILNRYREHKITRKMQFIMWFSGLRGAIAFALSLNLELKPEVRHVIITTTLMLVLFTTMVLGGGTMPLMKFLNRNSERPKKTNSSGQFVFFSKTKEMGNHIEMMGKIDEETNEQFMGDDSDIQFVRNRVRLRGFARVDEMFLKPFFIRKFTDEELQEGQSQMKNLTRQWFDEVNKDESKTSEAHNSTSFDDFKTRMRGKSAESSKTSNTKTYKKLNSTTISNALFDSADDNSENEEVIIDTSQFSLTTSI